MKDVTSATASGPKRRRNHAIRVYVDDAEFATIMASAGAAQMSESAFLRALGLGYQPKSLLDKEAIIQLVDVAGDQGRLGGLLKLWLRDHAGEGVHEHDVAQLLMALHETQAQIKQVVRRL